MTAFFTADFIQTELANLKGDKFICWLRPQSGRYTPDLIRASSNGGFTGYMIEPTVKPDWLIPGVIVFGTVLGSPVSLTLQPSFKSAIKEIDEELGERLDFTFEMSTEFKDERI
jgi:hypothetical protein